jgi:GNAT superfamily N-acetyltransferase
LAFSPKASRQSIGEQLPMPGGWLGRSFPSIRPDPAVNPTHQRTGLVFGRRLIAEFDASRLDELVAMWRASFEFGVGIVEPHPVAEQREYFLSQVLPHNEVRLALLANQVVGFVAASRQSVAQLYVRVGFHRRGIGTQLVTWAKQQSAGSLWLYTFSRNVGARAFYESQGFVPVSASFEPTRQLEDIKYEWVAPPRDAAR